MPLSGEAKKVYQRNLMRERRAAEKAKDCRSVDQYRKQYYPETKEPEKPGAASDIEWGICLKRAERARAYAEAMPGQVKPSEEVFQDSLWQWENEVRK